MGDMAMVTRADILEDAVDHERYKRLASQVERVEDCVDDLKKLYEVEGGGSMRGGMNSGNYNEWGPFGVGGVGYGWGNGGNEYLSRELGFNSVDNRITQFGLYNDHDVHIATYRGDDHCAALMHRMDDMERRNVERMALMQHEFDMRENARISREYDELRRERDLAIATRTLPAMTQAPLAGAAAA